MGWLVSYTLASIAASFVAVKIFDFMFAEVHNGFAGSARAGVFVATWTAVTAKAGMNGFSKRIRQLRQGFISKVVR